MHPVLKIVSSDYEGAVTALLSSPVALSLALPGAAALLPVLILLVAARKMQWQADVKASVAVHQPAFDAAWKAYLRQQRALVGRLTAARAAGERDRVMGRATTIAVTMATSQEGQSVVRALSAAPEHDGTTVRALVRNPSSVAVCCPCP